MIPLLINFFLKGEDFFFSSQTFKKYLKILQPVETALNWLNFCCILLYLHMKYIPIVYSEQQKKIVQLDTISVAFPLLLQEDFSKSNLGSHPQILDSYLN